MRATEVVHSDPEILGGTPVFVGTRVPVRTLIDHLEAGDSIEDFLRSFPSVSRDQAIAALELASDFLADIAHSPAWDSVAETAGANELPIPEWHREELDRRLADDEADPEAGAPWEEVRSRLERAR